jgi:hypothetical protein
LIEEARQHKRRRYGIMAALVLLLALGLLVGLVAGGVGLGDSTPSGVVPKTPLNAPQITAATGAAELAGVSVVNRNSSPGCPWSQTKSIGTIDFARAAIALTTITARSAYGLCPNEVGEQTRQFGTVVYHTVLPPQCNPKTCHTNPTYLPPASKPWVEQGSSQYPGGEIVSVLSTPFALVMLKAFPTSAAIGGTGSLHGEPVREYSETVSLAKLEAILNATEGITHRALLGYLSPAGALPPPKAIPVTMRLWVDSSHRVVRLSMTQPIYFVNYRSGASEGGPELVPSQYNGQVASDYPYKQGYNEVSTDFYQYGLAKAPVQPQPKAIFRREP